MFGIFKHLSIKRPEKNKDEPEKNKDDTTFTGLVVHGHMGNCSAPCESQKLKTAGDVNLK